MGGPRAFKAMQKMQQEVHNRWDQEDQASTGPDEEDAEDYSTEKRDLYAEYSIDEETENERSQREKAIGDIGEMPGQEDVSNSVLDALLVVSYNLQEFTMAMMLRTLNVNLEIVGYDKVQQRWSD